MPLTKGEHSHEKIVHKESESHDISDLIEATNKLINRIDKLVSLFDEAAKHVGEVESTEAKVAALSSKLESLLEQNKAIAQGLILLERYVKGKSGLSEKPSQMTEYS